MKSNKGQILLEVMIALSMVAIGLLGLLSLLTNSIGINKIISSEYVASYLASEGIEVVKNITDRNLSNGNGFNQGLATCEDSNGCRLQFNSPDSYAIVSANDGMPLKFDDQTKLYRYDSGEPTTFVRTIKVSEGLGGNELIVNSQVTWKARGSDYEITLEDHFFAWR